MASQASADPSYLQYHPSVEHAEADETQTAQELMQTMRSISEKTLADGGHAIRSVHAKSHGLLSGKLTVASGLPAELAQGMFAKPNSFPVVIRLSTIPGDLLHDSVSTPRGMAIKIIGVEGERLDSSVGEATQDFLLVNGSPVFGAPNAKKFLSTLKLVAKTTDRAEGAKKALSFVMRRLQRVIKTVTGKPSPTVATLGGQPETNILGETFFSQAPIRFGNYIAKISVVPVSPELRALTDAPVDIKGRPNGVRDAVVEFFRANGGEWDIKVQLCTSLDEMPVEDSSVVWSEDVSPYRTVARITLRTQVAWSEARSQAVDDGMSFSPWHGLAAHRPLGSIMRVRKLSYQAISRFRAEANGRPIVEPRELPPVLA